MFTKTKLTLIREELVALLSNYVGKPATRNNIQFLTHDLRMFFDRNDLFEIQYLVQLDGETVHIKPIRRIDELALMTLIPKEYLSRKDIF